MASAWVRQLNSQVARHGTQKASWYVFWKEPSGKLRQKSFGPSKRPDGTSGKNLAKQFAAQLNADLKLGRYYDVKPTTWDIFVKEYEEGHLARVAPGTRETYTKSLEHFESLCRLSGQPLSAIDARTIERFIQRRLKGRGSKPKSLVSVCTVNKNLRAIKAALGKAKKLGYIESVPSIEFLKEPEQLPPYITDAHFADILGACDCARRPDEHPRPSDWWRGLLVMDMLTGWRIGELLALEWQDVNLDEGFAVTRASANKSRREAVVWLHEVVRHRLAGLRLTADPRERVFAWHLSRRQLYDEFHRIQTTAGIKLACRIHRDHKCTDACHFYGFHDGRRAFATHNATRMSREALKVLMRHSSEQTTARYINYAQQIKPAAQAIHIPAVLRLPTLDGASKAE